MDLRKEWQQLHQEKFNYSSINKESIMNAIYQESTSTVSKLKYRLKGKLYWITFFITIGAIWMLFSLDTPDLLLIQGVFLTAYLLGGIFIGLEYRKLEVGFDLSDQTLPFMKKQAQIMKRALQFEKIWGLLFFPIAAVGGLAVGNISKGIALSELWRDPTFLLIALGCVAILAPLGVWLSDRLNDKSFGKLLKELQDNIRRMEDIL
ncbi:MAG: hypothetical protein AAF960_00075 [Bacteroidota bacterium]